MLIAMYVVSGLSAVALILSVKLQTSKAEGLSAAIYTQTTDVEGEVNGLVTYDRMVIKMDLDAIRAVHQELYAHGEERNPPSNQV